MKAAKVGSVIGGRTKRSSSMPVSQYAADTSLEDDDDQGDADGRFALQSAQDLRVQKGDDVLREGLLEKQVQLKDLAWVPRYVTLSTTALMFAVEAGGEIREQIGLLDISSCESVDGESHNTLRYYNKAGAREGQEGKGHSTLSQVSSRSKILGSFRPRRFERTASLDNKQEDRPKARSGGEDGPVSTSEWDYAISIHTERFGRTYYLRSKSQQDKDEWMKAIAEAIAEAQEERVRQMQLTARRLFKLKLRKAYDSECCQSLIAVFLVTNFVINVYDSETQHENGTQGRQILDLLESVFGLIYTVELAVNMYTHWFWQFFSNGWCVFDFIVVMMNVVEAIVAAVAASNSGTGGLSLVRMLRIFRIVRLFNKLKSLQKVIMGITSTLLPMSNIVIVFTVINSIYAVLATRLYAASYPEKFGSFFLSSFSMFQVATGDSWVTDVVWTLQSDPQTSSTGVLLFFTSYTVSVGIILFNITVAVLLEGFLGAIQQQERQARDREERQAMQKLSMALDPLLATLSNFSSPSHLTSQISLLFQLMDVDDSGTLSFQEMQEGMEALPLHPRVILSIEDWESLTLNGSVLDEHQCMDAASFNTAIRWQLMLYGQRLLSQRMAQAVKTKSDDPTSLFAMKLCLMQICGAPGHGGGGVFDSSLFTRGHSGSAGGGGGGGGGDNNAGDQDDDTLTSRSLVVDDIQKLPPGTTHVRTGERDAGSTQMAAMARQIEEGYRRTEMTLAIATEARDAGLAARVAAEEARDNTHAILALLRYGEGAKMSPDATLAERRGISIGGIPNLYKVTTPDTHATLVPRTAAEDQRREGEKQGQAERATRQREDAELDSKELRRRELKEKLADQVREIMSRSASGTSLNLTNSSWSLKYGPRISTNGSSTPDPSAVAAATPGSVRWREAATPGSVRGKGEGERGGEGGGEGVLEV